MIPITDANITRKKSNGITIVGVDNRNPSIVKNCASKLNIVINKINKREITEGKFAKNK